MLTLQIPRLSTLATSLSPNSTRSTSPPQSQPLATSHATPVQQCGHKHNIRHGHKSDINMNIPTPSPRPRFITPPLQPHPTNTSVHPSLTHFTYATKFHTQVLPKLAGPSNYSHWAANLERILTAQDLWSFVDPSHSSPAAFPSTDKVAARAYGHRRRRALMVVVLSCVWPVQQKVAGCTDAAVAWLILADYCEWAARDPAGVAGVGKHRFEYAFEGCRWEVWWLEGSANWEEWRLSLRVVLDAEGFGSANPTGVEPDPTEDEVKKRNEVSLAVVNICIEDGLRALVRKRGCRSGEEAIAALERLCGRKRSQSNAGLIDL